MAGPVKATERLYLTADKDRLVSESDSEAAFLFANEGDEVSEEDAKRYGLGRKAAARPADKQAEALANKGIAVTRRK